MAKKKGLKLNGSSLDIMKRIMLARRSENQNSSQSNRSVSEASQESVP